METSATDLTQGVPNYKRLALTIAGAVSLGSYEAGVMWEVFDAIAQHNQNPATTPGEKICVDVATGASAGGMTAIILAQKLLYEGHTFVGPYDNPLYKTWVERIDLSGLQNIRTGEPADQSLLSSDLITQISYETLMARYGLPKPPFPDPPTPLVQPPLQPFTMPPDRKPHPAIDPERFFRVGVAMTNLDGVDYQYPVQPQGHFGYREFADQRSRAIRPASSEDDTPLFWEPLREAACACGAFPFAFRPRDILRNCDTERNDYPADTLVRWAGDRSFTYTDGGILQNQPLGMAKNLVDLQDKHLGQENRFYLFVSPHEKDPGNPSKFTAGDANYFRMALQLVEAVMGQAGFRDWITAEKVNQVVSLMDDRATGLCKGIVDRVVDVQALQKTAEAILAMLFPEGMTNCPPGAKVDEEQAQARARLAKQYASEVSALNKVNIPEAAQAFIASMLAFETAAGLGARDTMQIYGITSKTEDLAGADIESFLGFFDQQYRLHDYDLGRTKAQAVLAGLQSGLGPLRYTPSKPDPQKLTSPCGVSYKTVDPSIKDRFSSHLEDRIRQAVLDQQGLGIWRRAVAWAARKLTGFVLDRIK